MNESNYRTKAIFFISKVKVKVKDKREVRLSFIYEKSKLEGKFS